MNIFNYGAEEISRVRSLVGEEWHHVIGDEFDKDYIGAINEFLIVERRQKIVYPKTNSGIFSVFRNVPFSKARVIIIGQDPYHDGSYCGRAFANKAETSKLSPSLRNIIKEVTEDVYSSDETPPFINPDLRQWEDQGVFLINTYLTVEAGNPSSHSHIGWDKFTGRAINALSESEEPKVFVLWGAHAKKFFVKYGAKNVRHLVLQSAHPSPFSANKGFFGSKPFSKINNFLKANNIKEIIW